MYWLWVVFLLFSHAVLIISECSGLKFALGGRLQSRARRQLITGNERLPPHNLSRPEPLGSFERKSCCNSKHARGRQSHGRIADPRLLNNPPNAPGVIFQIVSCGPRRHWQKSMKARGDEAVGALDTKPTVRDLRRGMRGRAGVLGL
jgi:hypothetical protein